MPKENNKLKKIDKWMFSKAMFLKGGNMANNFKSTLYFIHIKLLCICLFMFGGE